MIPRKVLVIDDEKVQSEALAKTIKEILPYSDVTPVWEENDIKDSVENRFYNLAVLDIRMDQYDIDGISIAKRIVEINPFAKIIFVSAFLSEYMNQVLPLVQGGNILGFTDKKNYDLWGKELADLILPYYESLDANPQQIQIALMQEYADLKNEMDSYKRGLKFENFVALLFSSMGFVEIKKRVKDKSGNETDLIIRNDIGDAFVSKFGKYILVECKNRTKDPVTKNDFIVFQTKLESTNGLAEIGFIITTTFFSKNAYIEALRDSKKSDHKVFFLDNRLLLILIQSDNMLEELKHIIDEQVKDN
ncbi:MAG: response regulator [Muribaculaceae bacterium]|nr:response regulator [Muribaculaceae bacterium]